MKEIEIPEGYEARIDGNKVIILQKESEDEKIRRSLIEVARDVAQEQFFINRRTTLKDVLAYLEKLKENPKSADSIQSDCVSDAKCEDRWHKVTDSLPDNGRLVLVKDRLGNVFLARYDGENWEVSVYDNEDYYCRNIISKWCEIPSEKQKDITPIVVSNKDWDCQRAYSEGYQKGMAELNKQKRRGWSEEDEKNLSRVISGNYLPLGLRHWFAGLPEKLSLRPQPNWKPSEEQMSALDLASLCVYADEDKKSTQIALSRFTKTLVIHIMITVLVILTLGFLPAFLEILAEIIRNRNGK